MRTNGMHNQVAERDKWAQLRKCCSYVVVVWETELQQIIAGTINYFSPCRRGPHERPPVCWSSRTPQLSHWRTDKLCHHLPAHSSDSLASEPWKQSWALGKKKRRNKFWLSYQANHQIETVHLSSEIVKPLCQCTILQKNTSHTITSYHEARSSWTQCVWRQESCASGWVQSPGSSLKWQSTGCFLARHERRHRDTNENILL